MSELRHRLTVRDLVEYSAFERVFGPLTVQERVDTAGGLAAWGSLAAMGAKKPPDEFVPKWEDERREQTDEEMIAFMRDFARKHKDGEGLSSGD